MPYAILLQAEPTLIASFTDPQSEEILTISDGLSLSESFFKR